MINIILLLFSSSLISVGGVVGLWGRILFWGSLAISFMLWLINKKGIVIYNKYNCAGVLIFLFYVLLRSQNLFGFKLFLQLLLLLLFLIVPLKFEKIKLSSTVLLFLFLVLLFLAWYLDISLSFGNPNIGALMILLVSFVTYYRIPRYKKGILGTTLIMLWILGSRSIFLALFIAAFLIYLIKRDFLPFKIIIFLFIVVLSVVLYLTYDLLQSPEFNLVVLSTTGKNFQSGRTEIWTAAFETMKGLDWFIGKGGGIPHYQLMPERFERLSLHSTYVFLLFHYGIVGLLLFFNVVSNCLNYLLKNRFYFSALIFLTIVIRDFFEITIVNNQMAVAFCFWSFFSCGMLEKMCKQSL